MRLIRMLVCFSLLSSMLAVVAMGAEPEASTEVEPAAVTEVVGEAVTEAVREEASKVVPGDAEAETQGEASTEATEEEVKELCDISTIDEVFKEYEKAVGPEQIKKIQLQLKIGGHDPKEIDGRTGPHTDAAFAQLCVDAGVDEHFKAQEDMDAGEARKRLARHLVALLFKPTINLTGGDCGCSRDFSALVYGFYPYLQAAGETQEVDLSLLGRIGFHALVLNKAGEIQDDLQWRSDNGNVADFIHEAHQHRVKVDVTFYMPDWQAWDFTAIDKAAKNIGHRQPEVPRNGSFLVAQNIAPGRGHLDRKRRRRKPVF